MWRRMTKPINARLITRIVVGPLFSIKKYSGNVIESLLMSSK